jgi:hypothetical protein
MNEFSNQKMIYIETRYTETLDQFTEYLINNSQLNWKIVRCPFDCDVALFIDVINSESIVTLKNSSAFKVLVRQEPKLVLPKNYDEDLVIRFDHIIDIGKSREDLSQNINWPQDLSYHFDAVNSKKTKFVLINSNLLSLKDGENYSLRRKVVAEIQTLDLYGFRWNNSCFDKLLTFAKELKKYLPKIYLVKLNGLKCYFRTFDNFLGEVENKREVMSLYKYSLVIENSCDYVSEKLFDSFLSGCLPVYVGSDLSKYDIPESLYIQAEPNLEDIKSKMIYAQGVNHAEWSIRLRSWLAEESTYKNWSSKFFFSKILTSIDNVYQ